MDMKTHESRIGELAKVARRRRLDLVLVSDQANIRAITGVNSDNAVLAVTAAGSGVAPKTALYTDFRYVPMVHRVAPKLACLDIKRLKIVGSRIGYESSIPHSRYLSFVKRARRAKFVDVAEDMARLRAGDTSLTLVRNSPDFAVLQHGNSLQFI